MKTKNLLHFLLIVLVSICFSSCSFSQDKTKAQKTTTIPSAENVHYKVTFIELGSVRCIPCQKMQPVMKNIEEKYGKEVKVVFHDVWTPDGKPYAQKFKIEAIPTQVFLDENGKEFFRHTGFFPEEELVNVLKQKGVK